MLAHPFEISVLLWPALAIAMCGFAVSLYVVRNVFVSCIAALVKSILFVVYFGYVFDGTYTFLDDWSYLQGGEILTSQGIGVLNTLSYHAEAVLVAQSTNYSYYVFNAIAIQLFGDGYFAPVAMNIILTFVAALFLVKVARATFGVSHRQGMGLFLLLLFSPDVLAWSTLINLKDVLIMAATAAVVYAVSQVETGRLVRATVWSVVGCIILFSSRFYVPLMLATAFAITLFVSRKAWRKPWLLGVGVIIFVGAAEWLGLPSIQDSWALLRANFVNPVIGFVRFMVTPIPFHTDPSYAFLDLPQIYYWLVLPLLAYGILFVWKIRGLTARFVVIYFLCMVLLYSVFVPLQGPRQRIQITGLIVIFQYFGFLWLLRLRRARRHHRSTVFGNSQSGGGN